MRKIKIGDSVYFQGSHGKKVYCINPKKKLFMIYRNALILHEEDYIWSNENKEWVKGKDYQRKRDIKSGWKFPKCECDFEY